MTDIHKVKCNCCGVKDNLRVGNKAVDDCQKTYELPKNWKYEWVNDVKKHLCPVCCKKRHKIETKVIKKLHKNFYFV